jgi:carboxypeptidase T
MKLILKVTPGTSAQPLRQVYTMAMNLDVWTVRGDHMILRAEEAQADQLRQLGFGVEEIQPALNYLETHFTAEAIEGYHSPESLNDDMSSLAAAHPDLAELQTFGTSVEGRPMLALRLGTRTGSGAKSGPKVLLLGCHHAREWLSVEVPFLVARHLLENAGDPEIGGWLASGEIWVAPMVNPDGHAFTRDRSDPENRLWRKNRRVNGDGSIGVDPNRNYDYMWGSLDIDTSSKTPSAETYIGPSPFSEPETQAVSQLVETQAFDGLITYHSYSQLILYPWGYTSEPISDAADRERMIAVSQEMAELIRGVHGRVYVPQQSSELYPTAGDTTDWAYGKLKIPAITIELRPETYEQGGFILPANQIRPTFEENLPAALLFIRGIFGVAAA